MIKWKAQEVKLKLSWIDPKSYPTSPQFTHLAKGQKVISIKVDKQAASMVVDPSQLKYN